MPRITTDSGKTLDDLFANLEEHAREYNDTAIKGRWLDRQAEPLNDECKDRDSITRRGDSIVPGYIDIAGRPFRLPTFHHDDPHTSKTAAASVVQIASRHRELILQALKEIGPSTGHELAQHLGLEYVQVAKRLTELHTAGSIKRRIYGSPDALHEWGTYQTRPSPSGRQACVWHLNPLKS